MITWARRRIWDACYALLGWLPEGNAARVWVAKLQWRVTPASDKFEVRL